MKNCYHFLLIGCFVVNVLANEKVHYVFLHDPIDVVIPCHAKDADKLELVIEGIKKNGNGIRRIITVSEYQMTPRAEWISETVFPFDKKAIAYAIAHDDEELASDLFDCPVSRAGWIFQQLIKLYAAFVIPEISSNILVLDADTIFLNPVSFMNDEHEPLFNVGSEYHEPYFVHAAKLLDEPYSIKKLFPEYSGICHHMLLQKPVLEDLFEKIEKKSGKPMWVTLCENVDLTEFYGSTMSEYEIYFNFIMSRTDQAHIRPLKWKNLCFVRSKPDWYRRMHYHYVSYHSWVS